MLLVILINIYLGFLNLRGSDIDYNPVFFAYLVITPTELVLFVDSNKLPLAFDQHKLQNNVEIEVLEYDFIDKYLQECVSKNVDVKI